MSERPRMFQSGAGVDEICAALGYKNAKTARSDIRKAIGSARSERPPRRRDADDGLPVSVLNARDRATRRLIERHAKERHERLEALLRARRLHVTQMTVQQLGDRVLQDV